MEFMLITNNPSFAVQAVSGGVNYLFIDLESIGKIERQGQTQSFISSHTIEDVGLIRNELPDASILVRINPVNTDSKTEIEEAISRGADIIMLPMFKKIDELILTDKLIKGRAEFWPLVETVDACNLVIKYAPDIAAIADKVYFGLNDLHLELRLKFIFSALFDRRVSDAIEVLRRLRLPFGFGGISTLDARPLSGRHVLALHQQFGSDLTILSRSFQNNVADGSLHDAVNALRTEKHLLRLDQNYAQKMFIEAVKTIKILEETL
jgi:hypothetical protein